MALRFATHGSASRANPLPLVVAVIALVASVTLALLSSTVWSEPVTMFGLAFPVVRAEHLWAGIVGYVLTLAIAVLYPLDRSLQWKGQQHNRDFITRPVFSRTLQWLLIASFLVMVWHLTNLAVRIPEMLGLE